MCFNNPDYTCKTVRREKINHNHLVAWGYKRFTLAEPKIPFLCSRVKACSLWLVA